MYQLWVWEVCEENHRLSTNRLLNRRKEQHHPPPHPFHSVKVFNYDISVTLLLGYLLHGERIGMGRRTVFFSGIICSSCMLRSMNDVSLTLMPRPDNYNYAY
jgi:hypothetical protein